MSAGTFKICPFKPPPPEILTRVNRDHSEGFYGPFDVELLATKATTYISSNSDANGALTEVIRAFLELAQKDYVATASANGELNAQATQSCWLAILLTLPTERWAVSQSKGAAFQVRLYDSRPIN